MIARELKLSNTAKSSTKRLSSYISNPQNCDSRLGYFRISNCNTVDDEKNAVRQMLLTQSMNIKAKSDPIMHLVLSFHERPDDKSLAEIEDYLMEKLGYLDHERITRAHGDTDHFHLHLIINKINPTTYKLHSPWHSHKTLLDSCDFLEKKYGLKHDNHEIKNTAKRTRAKDMEAAGDCESLTGFIQRECLNELKEANTWEEFQHTCLDHNISFKKRANGFVFSADDYKIYVKASSIDRDLSFAKLEKKFGKYTDKMAKEFAKDLRFKKGRKKKAAQKAYALRNMGNDTPEGEELWKEYRQYAKQKEAEAEQSSEEDRAARFKIRKNPLVSEEVGRKLLSCGNWREFHAICRKEGLIFKKRANGLAFYKKGEDGKVDFKNAVKSSDVHRRLCKKEIEERLGSFKSPADLYERDKASAAQFLSNEEDAALLDRLKKSKSWDEMYWECDQKGYFLFSEGGSLFIQHKEQVHGIFRLNALDPEMKQSQLEKRMGDFREGSVIHEREVRAKQAETDNAMRNAFYARAENFGLVQKIVDAVSWQEVLDIIEDECPYEVVNYANDLYFVDRGSGTGKVYRFGALNDHMSRDALEEEFGSLDAFLENLASESEEECPVKTPSFEDLWGDYQEMSEAEREEWLWGKQAAKSLKEGVSNAYADIPRGDSAANALFLAVVDDQYMRRLWFELDRLERYIALRNAEKARKRLRRQQLENRRMRANFHNWRTYLQKQAKRNDPRAINYLVRRRDPTADFARLSPDREYQLNKDAEAARDVQKVTMQGTRIYSDSRERNGELLFSYTSSEAEISHQLSMARERFGDVLLLNGDAPAEFQTKVAKAARELGIRVTNIAPYLTKVEQAKAEAERKIREAREEAEEKASKARKTKQEEEARKEEERKRREEEVRKKQEEDFRQLERETKHIVDSFVREYGFGSPEYTNPVALEKMRNARELITLHKKGVYAAAKKTNRKVAPTELNRELAVRLRATGHSEQQVADLLSQAEGYRKCTDESVQAAAYAFSAEGGEEISKQARYVKKWKLNEETVNTAWFAEEGSEQEQTERQERKVPRRR